MESKLIAFVLFFGLGAIVSYGQVDTTIYVQRKGVDAVFRYKKFKKSTDIKPVDLPLYGTTRENIARTSTLLKGLVEIENEKSRLITAYTSLDSERITNEIKLNEVITLQKDRANNAITSFDSLKTAYDRLDSAFLKCNSLARKKTGFWNVTKRALPFLGAGLIIGFIAGK